MMKQSLFKVFIDSAYNITLPIEAMIYTLNAEKFAKNLKTLLEASSTYLIYCSIP